MSGVRGLFVACLEEAIVERDEAGIDVFPRATEFMREVLLEQNQKLTLQPNWLTCCISRKRPSWVLSGQIMIEIVNIDRIFGGRHVRRRSSAAICERSSVVERSC